MWNAVVRIQPHCACQLNLPLNLKALDHSPDILSFTKWQEETEGQFRLALCWMKYYDRLDGLIRLNPASVLCFLWVIQSASKHSLLLCAHPIATRWWAVVVTRSSCFCLLLTGVKFLQPRWIVKGYSEAYEVIWSRQWSCFSFSADSILEKKWLVSQQCWRPALTSLLTAQMLSIMHNIPAVPRLIWKNIH